MEPGSPAFGHWADPDRLPQGSEVCSRWASLHPLFFAVLAAGRSETESGGRHRTHLPQVDLELSPGLELELAAASPGSTTGGRFELRSDKPVGAMRLAVATGGASPLRLPGFAGSSFGSPLENGRPGAFPNGGDYGEHRSSSATRIRSAGALTARPSGRFSSPELGVLASRSREADDLSRPTPCRSWVLRRRCDARAEFPTIRSGVCSGVDPAIQVPRGVVASSVKHEKVVRRHEFIETRRFCPFLPNMRW